MAKHVSTHMTVLNWNIIPNHIYLRSEKAWCSKNYEGLTEKKNESQMLHFNLELDRCQLILTSEASPAGVITQCLFPYWKEIAIHQLIPFLSFKRPHVVCVCVIIYVRVCVWDI